MLAKDIMTTDVYSVSPEDTVEKVIELLLKHKISGVPVVDHDMQVVGVVSEGDLMVRSQTLHTPTYIQILGGVIYLDDPDEFKDELKKAIAYKVEDIMTVDPVTVNENATVEELATTMSEAGINRLPVVRDERLVGIVSRADIIRSFARKG